MKFSHVKLLVIAYALFSTASAAANSVVVSDDTWVEGDAVTTVFGDSTAVIAKNNGSNNINVRFPFFRFNLSNYSEAFSNDDGLNLAIISANQGSVPTPPQKYQGAVPNGPATFVVELWGLKEAVAWSETTLTWNSAKSNLVNLGTGYPGQAGRGFNPAQATLLATCSVPANDTPFAWFCSSEELTAFMNDRLGEDNATLMFRRTDTNSQANWGAASKEYSNTDLGVEVGDFAPTFGPKGVFGDGSGPVPTGTYQGGEPQITNVADAASVADNIVEADIKGQVTDTGGDNPERFCRFREQGSETWIIRSLGVGSAGSFACNVSGLKPGTTYETQTYVTNAGGTVYETAETLTTPAATLGVPELSSLPVNSGSNAGGNSVEVLGNRFVIGGTEVTFGGVAATSVNVLSATKLFAVVPPSSARSSVEVDVLVTTDGGTSSALPYTYTLDTEVTVPGSPTGASAIAGDGQATVSWLAPANNGGSNITGYRVTGVPGGSCQVDATETQCTISGLTNGSAYAFSVVAINSVGDSQPSAASSSVTPTRPLSSSSISVPNLNDQVYSGGPIEPEVAASDGLTDLILGTDYSIAFSDNTDVGTATASLTGTGAYSGSVQRTFEITPKPLAITGLTGVDKVYDSSTTATASGTAALDGVVTADTSGVSLTGTASYTFASADVGTGIAITTTGFALDGTKKDNYSLTQPTLSADITPKPLTDGSISIDAIADQAYTGNAITPTVVVKDGTTTLVKDIDYTLTFSANTNVGTATVTLTGNGNYGQTTQVTFKIVASRPQPPTNLVATPGDGQVLLSWTAPADTGGSEITGYTATAVPANDGGRSTKICTTAGATECVITDLTNDLEYAFSVIATTAGGDSDPSAIVKATTEAVIPPLPVSVNHRWALWLLIGLVLSLAWLRPQALRRV